MNQPNRKAKFTKEEDIFVRKPVGDGIIKLIDTQTNHQGALTISIDAPWGIGKTTFISMLENTIKDNPATDWRTVYFDAWENDMSDDPFTSILFHICGQLPQEFGPTIKEFINEIFSSADKFLELFPGPIPKVIGAGLGLASKMVKHTGRDDISEAYSTYEAHKKSFHDNLSSIASKCKKLIVFIDELDRCKPTFAVNLLETIKHYFDIDNMVFVFGIDGTQLRETIKHYYGSGFDSSSYLTRFFEYQLSLPRPEIEQMIAYCNQSHKIPHDVHSYLQAVFEFTNITPREVKSIIDSMNTIGDYYLNKLDAPSLNAGLAFIGLLLSIKCKKKNVYDRVIIGDHTTTTTNSIIDNDLVYISSMCKTNINQCIYTKAPYIHYPLFDDALRNNIIPSLEAMLHHDRSVNIGYSLQRILNIIEIPNPTDFSKTGEK